MGKEKVGTVTHGNCARGRGRWDGLNDARPQLMNPRVVARPLPLLVAWRGDGGEMGRQAACACSCVQSHPAGPGPALPMDAMPVLSRRTNFFLCRPSPGRPAVGPPTPPPRPHWRTAHLLAPGGGGGLGPWKFFEGRCPVRRKTSNGGPALLFPSHRYCYCYYYLYRVTPDSGIVRSVLRWGLRPCECACKHACWYGRCWKERDIIVTCYTFGIMDRL